MSIGPEQWGVEASLIRLIHHIVRRMGLQCQPIRGSGPASLDMSYLITLPGKPTGRGGYKCALVFKEDELRAYRRWPLYRVAVRRIKLACSIACEGAG